MAKIMKNIRMTKVYNRLRLRPYFLVECFVRLGRKL